MRIIKENKCLILAALVFMGLGILEIKYPHAMNWVYEDLGHYYVRSISVLLLFLFFAFTWGYFGGFCAIMLGVLMIILSLSLGREEAEQKKSESIPTNYDQNSSADSISSLAFNAGKTYIQKRLRNQLENR
jgi:lysylphosphatidylglycerol synthetase-like protein (DUF2156 family)